MKPATPLSPGRPAPPRSATPASVLNAHKLVGGATRVVMLKHRDNAPRPAVSFGGKSVSAVAMLVGGGLELPIQTLEFLVKLHRAQDRAILRAANMTEVQLTVEGAEHDVVDDLLEDLTSLRRTFYVSVENVTARAQSTRGSRKVGQDSDDELSAGDREQDDEE